MENIDVCFSYTPLSTCGSWRRTLNEDIEFSMGVGKLESPTVLSVEQDRECTMQNSLRLENVLWSSEEIKEVRLSKEHCWDGVHGH